MQPSPDPIEINLPEPIRIRRYTPIDPALDFTYPDFIYEGSKYRTAQQTDKMRLDEQISEHIYRQCYEGHLWEPVDLHRCYKHKMAIFRDIIHILKNK